VISERDVWAHVYAYDTMSDSNEDEFDADVQLAHVDDEVFGEWFERKVLLGHVSRDGKIFHPELAWFVRTYFPLSTIQLVGANVLVCDRCFSSGSRPNGSGIVSDVEVEDCDDCDGTGIVAVNGGAAR
jgi:hypothetical protein